MDNAPTFANSLGLIVTFIIIAVVFLAVIVAAVTQRRREEHREEALFRLGYTPVTPPPQELVDQIADLRGRRGGRGLALEHVFRRPISGGELYIFDVTDSGEGDTTPLAEGAVALISPALELPRFTLIPRFDFGTAANGLLTQLAERALSWAASRTGMAEISFRDGLGFDQAFITLTDVPSETRDFLTAARRTELLQMARRYIVDAAGNTLMLTRNPTERADDTLTDRIPLIREDAERILSWFRAGGIRYA